MPAMKLRIARPALLVDIGRIADLVVRARGGRHDRDRCADAPQGRRRRARSSRSTARSCRTRPARSATRRCGTAARSAARSPTAIPASDLPAVILALDARARRHEARRAIGRSPAADFFTGVFQTALAPDEMLVEIRVPKLGSSRLVVHEDEPASPGLGDRRRRGGRRARNGALPTTDRAHEHGRDAASGEGGRGRARGRLARSRTQRRSRPRERSRRRITRRARSSGATSHAFSRKRALDEAASR